MRQQGDRRGWSAAGGAGRGMEALEPRALLSSAMAEPDPLATAVENAALIVMIGQNQAKSLAYVDADGTKVTISLRGAGTAAISLSGSDLHATDNKGKVTIDNPVASIDVTLASTDARSALTFLSKGGGDGGLMIVGRIDGSSPLGKLTGKGVDLNGDGIVMAGDGVVSAILVNSLGGEATIQMTGAGDARGASIALNHAAPGSSILTATGLKTLQFGDSSSADIAAPWVGTIRAKGTLAGAVTISGQSAGGLAIGGVVAGQLRDFTVSGSAIGAIAAASWLGGSLQAQTLKSLKVVGELNAPVQIGTAPGASTASIGSASAGAPVAGSIRVGSLRSRLRIVGDAKSVSLNDPLTIGPVASATGGQLDITGTASVKGLRQSFRGSGLSLYTSTQQMYDLADLLLFERVGSHMSYELITTSDSVVGGRGTVDVSVTGGNGSYTVNEANSNDETQIWRWTSDATGTSLLERTADAESIGASLAMTFDDLRVAATAMPNGVSEEDAAPAHLRMSMGWVRLDLEGTARASSRLLGHETRSVPAGTFTAAKFEIHLVGSFSGLFDTTMGSNQRITVRFDETLTYWAVPGVGVIESKERLTVSASAAGAGSESASGSEVHRLLP